MQYDPKAPPFWEQERGSGPAIDRNLWEEKRHQREKIQELRSQLSVLDQKINYMEETWNLHMLAVQREVLLKKLQELGYKPRTKPPKTARRENDYNPDWSQTRVRASGSMGDGNRWVGHGNIKYK